MSCPNCGVYGSLELFCTDADARAFATAMGAVPPQLAKLVTEYLGLFRPSPKRALAFPRARRLLDELVPMISSGVVERNRRTWSAPLDAWRSAIQHMLDNRDKLTVPLKSHGYLLEIMVALANKVEGKAEAQLEEQRRHGARSTMAHSEPMKVGASPEAQRAWIAAENATRKRLNQPPMTADEERALIDRTAS